MVEVKGGGYLRIVKVREKGGSARWRVERVPGVNSEPKKMPF